MSLEKLIKNAVALTTAFALGFFSSSYWKKTDYSELSEISISENEKKTVPSTENARTDNKNVKNSLIADSNTFIQHECAQEQGASTNTMLGSDVRPDVNFERYPEEEAIGIEVFSDEIETFVRNDPVISEINFSSLSEKRDSYWAVNMEYLIEQQVSLYESETEFRLAGVVCREKSCQIIGHQTKDFALHAVVKKLSAFDWFQGGRLTMFASGGQSDADKATNGNIAYGLLHFPPRT
jgi:hypothetical protein